MSKEKPQKLKSFSDLQSIKDDFGSTSNKIEDSLNEENVGKSAPEQFQIPVKTGETIRWVDFNFKSYDEKLDMVYYTNGKETIGVKLDIDQQKMADKLTDKYLNRVNSKIQGIKERKLPETKVSRTSREVTKAENQTEAYIKRILENKKIKESVIKILTKEDLILATHGSSYEDRKTGKTYITTKTDFDAKSTAYILELAQIKVSAQKFVEKGISKDDIKQRNSEPKQATKEIGSVLDIKEVATHEDKNADVYFDAGENGEILKVSKDKDGKEYLVFGNHFYGRKEKTSSAQVLFYILKETGLLKKDLIENQNLKNLIDFNNDTDNLIVPKEVRDDFKNKFPKTPYGQYKNIPFEEIVKHFESSKKGFDELNEEVLNEKVKSIKNGSEVLVTRKQKIIDNIFNSEKGIKNAKKEMLDFGIKSESDELGKVLVNNEKTSRIYTKEMVKLAGFDTGISFSENGVFISSPAKNIEKYGEELKKKFPEIKVINSMILYFPKETNFDKDEFLRALNLLEVNNKDLNMENKPNNLEDSEQNVFYFDTSEEEFKKAEDNLNIEGDVIEISKEEKPENLENPEDLEKQEKIKKLKEEIEEIVKEKERVMRGIDLMYKKMEIIKAELIRRGETIPGEESEELLTPITLEETNEVESKKVEIKEKEGGDIQIENNNVSQSDIEAKYNTLRNDAAFVSRAFSNEIFKQIGLPRGGDGGALTSWKGHYFTVSEFKNSKVYKENKDKIDGYFKKEYNIKSIDKVDRFEIIPTFHNGVPGVQIGASYGEITYISSIEVSVNDEAYRLGKEKDVFENELEKLHKEKSEQTQNSQNEEILESKKTEQVEKQENSLERKDLEIIGYGDSVSGDSIHKVTESPNEDTVYVIKKDKSGNLFLDVWEEAHKRIITNSDFAEGSSKIKLSPNPTLLRVTLGELTKDDNGKYIVTKQPIVKFVDENYKD
jgi:hypothetical protein